MALLGIQTGLMWSQRLSSLVNEAPSESAKSQMRGPTLRNTLLCQVGPKGHQCEAPVTHTETVGPVFLSNNNNGTGPWGVRWLDNSILLHILQLFGHLLANSERHLSWRLFLGAGFSRVNLHVDKVCLSMLTIHQTKYIMMVYQELLKQFYIRQGQLR